MKVLPLIFGVIPSLMMASTVPLDREIVQIQECGMEQRDNLGQLLPIAIFEPIYLKCDNCSIEFTFNVPHDGGHPAKVAFRYVGMSQPLANEYRETFIRGWVFPGCIQSGRGKAFIEERRTFNA